MIHENELRNFLKKYININKDRLTNATNKTDSLITFIQNNLDSYKSSAFQWSFSYWTIIKPNPDNEEWKYDVDLAIRFKYIKDFEGNEKEYHNLLIDLFSESDRYKDKLDLSKERSVRIQYDSNDWEFFVDLVPMFNDWENWNVIDRKNNVIEISWGSQFRDWVNWQNNKTSVELSKDKFLKETIRIFKYLRDIHNNDIIRSVQLTLLLSRQIDKLWDSDFATLTSTLYWVSLKLKEELENINEVSELDLSNPWLSEEVFNRKFDNEKFNNFKEWVIEQINKIESAYNEEDEDNSISKWKDIFGEKFASEEVSKNIILYNYDHAETPNNYGWIQSIDKKYISIIAKKRSKATWKEWYMKNWDIVPNDMIYRFYAKINENLWSCKLYWQVTNENNRYVVSKRWEINNPSKDLWYSKNIKWYWIEEEWRWSWKHWVKCFIINQNNEIVGESENFFIIIAR